MAWQTIVEANSLEEFEAATPDIGELPVGTLIKITIDTKVPIAPILDIPWLSERLAQLLLGQGKVISVYNVGWYELVINLKTTGTATIASRRGARSTSIGPLAIIAIIAGSLAAIAWAIAFIKMDVDLPEALGKAGTIVKWTAIGVLSVLGIKLVSDLLKKEPVR